MEMPTGIEKIILVRHGDYDNDRRNNPPLNKMGRGEARARGDWLSNNGYNNSNTIIFTSPKARALSTAQEIGQRIRDNPYQEDWCSTILDEDSKFTVHHLIAAGDDQMKSKMIRDRSQLIESINGSPIRRPNVILVTHDPQIRYLARIFSDLEKFSGTGNTNGTQPTCGGWILDFQNRSYETLPDL